MEEQSDAARDGGRVLRFPVREATRPVAQRDLPPIGGSALLVGDAQDALAGLLAEHAGSVRAALLDPPYNTASRFHHYDDSLSHDAWLAERREHFALVRELLREDGSLWVHLDDSEMHYGKVMLDTLFGRSNFVATVVWQKTRSRENRTDLSTTHEYVLVFAKDRRAWAAARNLLPFGEEQLGRYRNPDGDPRGPWTSGDLTAKAGPGRRASQFYDVVTPSGRVVRPAKGMAWRYTRERFDELLADGRITFGDGAQMPRLKRFLSETKGGLVPTTWWPGLEVGTTDTAKKHLRRLFPDLVPFETPKPEELALRVLRIATDPGDLVLDCYAGSGTTPAVAHKSGRRWIAVERERRTVDEFLLPRLDRVVAGEDPWGVTAETGWTGGGDFALLDLAEVSGELAR
ncbi:MAG TPA: site-specific DNA-methyltransferase [Egibacteraceae bacterium]|nr:site-specific DNA-methyltransferase [Egibacteraceae bacterium]